jgi:1-pyrroline-5-carboxylate dehydrogenase
MGPAINEKQLQTDLSYVEIGKNEGAKLVCGGNRLDKGEYAHGWFMEPTVFIDVDPKMRIAQEEIFGPVLTVIKAKDFDEALHIANDTEYGLTGSLYSKDEKHIERAKQEYFVGNLYFNRKSTGALVGVHPFGGFNMSGTDSKAGGSDYLLLFTQAKAISAKKA